MNKLNKLIIKIKSPVFWTELVLVVAQILKLFGVYEVSNDMLSTVQDIITAIFTVFATLNNPDTKEEF